MKFDPRTDQYTEAKPQLATKVVYDRVCLRLTTDMETKLRL